MSWRIDVPYRDRDEALDPLSIHETTAAISDEREREVTRGLLRDLYLDGRCDTFGAALDRLERADGVGERADLELCAQKTADCEGSSTHWCESRSAGGHRPSAGMSSRSVISSRQSGVSNGLPQ